MAKSSSIGGIFAELTLRDAKFKQGLKGASRSLRGFKGSSVSTMGSIGGKMGVAMGAAFLLAGGGSVALAVKSIGKAADMEMMEAQFEVMTGSAEKAKDMISELRKEATASPLSLNDFVQSAQKLIGFGMAQEKVIETTKMLSEVSMGNAERFDTLSLAFAQTSAAGRLMGQEVLQFVNSGFNPLKQISEDTGESMVALKKRMEDGLIPFSEVEAAFRSATSEGGRFYKMNEKAANTYTGKVAKMKDAWDQLLVSIGTPMIDNLKPLLDQVNGYDFATLGNNLADSLSSAFALITSGRMWEMFQLQGEKAFLQLQGSDAINGWAATINSVIDTEIDPFGSMSKGYFERFGENFDMFSQGTRGNVDAVSEIDSQLADLTDAIQKDAEQKEKDRNPATAPATPREIVIPLDDPVKASKKIKSIDMPSMDFDSYRARGLSLSESPSASNEKKILDVTTKIHRILERFTETKEGGLNWT